MLSATEKLTQLLGTKLLEAMQYACSKLETFLSLKHCGLEGTETLLEWLE